MAEAAFTVREIAGYRYVDEGPPSDLPPVVLLHGMLGDLSNWTHTVAALAENQYRVVAPVIPVYDMPLRETSVTGLVEYVRGFVEALGLEPAVLVGNSLGGHIALIYAMRYPDDVRGMVLSGASGIYETTLGSSTPRRQDREYIRERAAVTFYDPVHVTDEMVDEMYDVVNDRGRALRLIMMARSTKAETVTERLAGVPAPTLLVWGQDDNITPPDVAYEFLERLPNATLYLIERCGHAPMMEHPERFNQLMLDFLADTIRAPRLASEEKA